METAKANMRAKSIAGRRGFTLLEVLLALMLAILLISGVFGFYQMVLRAQDEGTTATRDCRMGRSILASMANEIRHATSIVPGDGIGFQGDRYKITIVKLGLTERYAFDEYEPMRDKLPPAQLDLRRVTYELLWDDELKDLQDDSKRLCHGLWRTEQKTFDPNPSFVVNQDDPTSLEDAQNTDNPAMLGPQPEGELYAPEIKYLEFAYFDGAQWRDRWQTNVDGEASSGSKSGSTGVGPLDSGSPLPQAVRITIGKVSVDPENEVFDLSKWSELESNPEEKEYYPDRFTIVVPVLEADRTLMSSRKYGVSDSIARQEGGGTQ